MTGVPDIHRMGVSFCDPLSSYSFLGKQQPLLPYMTFLEFCMFIPQYQSLKFGRKFYYGDKPIFEFQPGMRIEEVIQHVEFS